MCTFMVQTRQRERAGKKKNFEDVCFPNANNAVGRRESENDDGVDEADADSKCNENLFRSNFINIVDITVNPTPCNHLFDTENPQTPSRTLQVRKTCQSVTPKACGETEQKEHSRE